jgi:hypothetical protein
MQAYYEIETQIPQNHQLQLQLPETIPAGHAKIAVIYELPEATENKAVKMAAFLNGLPDETDESGMSREAINEFLQQERQDWVCFRSHAPRGNAVKARCAASHN